MRRKIIAGNWKMHKTVTESLELVRELSLGLKDVKDVEIVVCPVFTALYSVGQELSSTAIKLGAQNMFWEEKGAFTGEIAGPMLRDVHCTHAIIGHSERRTIFGETNDQVNRKVKAALRCGLRPIICVGERLEEREAGKTFDVIRSHVQGAIAGISADELPQVVVAYEPVWAIGTGKTATPAQAQEAHAFIRGLFAETFGSEAAGQLRIQYGGSVTPENSAELLRQPDIDGALVGGASLKAESFLKIVKSAGSE